MLEVGESSHLDVHATHLEGAFVTHNNVGGGSLDSAASSSRQSPATMTRGFSGGVNICVHSPMIGATVMPRWTAVEMGPSAPALPGAQLRMESHRQSSPAVAARMAPLQVELPPAVDAV
jgi:hypothetical protein